MKKDRIRIGTRGSRLALRQAEMVQEAIARADVCAETELVILHTKGDQVLDKPLVEIGDKGLFVSEFEQALLEDRIDLAVHSAKDLPMRLAGGLAIRAVLPRADVRDVLVVRKGEKLPPKAAAKGAKGQEGRPAPQTGCRESFKCPASQAGCRESSGRPFLLGTGSKRRQIQAQELWKDISCSLIRGNVESRLRKLEEGSYDGILLAKAGLDRLNIGAQTDSRFDFYELDAEQFLPAACQGIIAVEAKEVSRYEGLLERISDAEASLCFAVEQEVLAQLQADCSEAAAAWCRRREDILLLDVMYGKNRASFFCEATKEAGLQLAGRAAEAVRPSGLFG